LSREYKNNDPRNTRHPEQKSIIVGTYILLFLISNRITCDKCKTQYNNNTEKVFFIFLFYHQFGIIIYTGITLHVIITKYDTTKHATMHIIYSSAERFDQYYTYILYGTWQLILLIGTAITHKLILNEEYIYYLYNYRLYYVYILYTCIRHF